MNTSRIIQKIKVFILIITVSLLSNCSLDEELRGVPNKDFIKKTSDIQLLVDGMYASFNPNAFKLYLYYMIITDDIVYANSLNAEVVQTANRTYDSTNTRNQLLWNTFYNILNGANHLLAFIEDNRERFLDAEGNEPEILTEARGHAHFVRGFIYYYLVRLYGGVPLRTKNFTLEEEKFLKRASVDEVYKLIFEDLKQASLLLPTRTNNTVQGLATEGAAEGILASASLTYANYLDYMNKGDKIEYYTQAKFYAQKVINSGNYSLVDDFARLWDVNLESENYATEVIYGIQYTRDPFNNLRTSLGSHFARDYGPNQAIEFSKNSVGIYPVQPYIYEIYSSGDYAGDYRTKVSFTTNWRRKDGREILSFPETLPTPPHDYGVSNFPYIAKYKDASATEYNAENDMYVIRLAEMYMIVAEAENEINGPTQEAYNAFNTIRERARKADGTASANPKNLADGLSKEEFRLAIFWERGLEFLAEDLKRFFDLIRMKAPNGDVMYMYQIEKFLPKIPEGAPRYVNGSWIGGRKINEPFKYFTRRNLLLPIPKSEIDNNPNFGGQNPGW
ncbi:RagB/SusD family nutrient uptake outer membrane protein [Dysgonomonas sp. Marseille-P4677]|uniref:RagB/SusD family nutrient uptake outer membrane protein n=1 Tax=Dysgonomonas sp. Marseille-P4677 TaxID=2364790 RepID=UPI001913945B|nr:RagB/SusD family nutrient uptake outer membrane protein [Dysgonomonas sp. Marseille-P4677]MBK5719865.1 RagB/SusD family nutrient uptake outer membrane protein [Dysgonomonas sp. Marseille-P4677]